MKIKFILFSLILITLFFAGCQDPNQNPQTEQPPSNNTASETDFELYSSSGLKITLLLPLSYTITLNNLIQAAETPGGKDWLGLEFSKITAMEKPTLRLDVNPVDYDLGLADKVFDIIENTDGDIDIIAEKITSHPQTNDGQIILATYPLQAQNGYTYYFRFEYAENGLDYEPLFKKIINNSSLN
jgi:hypothetical protein